jgi:hypothetical protein
MRSDTVAQLSLGLDDRSAVLSPCRRYRYALYRRWAVGPQALWVMLNPSTADESLDDPTIRRCIGFSKAWGYGGLAVGNLFALRATDPQSLYRDPDPVGPQNDVRLYNLIRESDLVIAAWGNHGAYQGRGIIVRTFCQGWQVLGLTKEGQPRHPLYLAAATRPIRWLEPATAEE